MAAQSDYIGQYGDALRQMQQGVLPQPMGGADTYRGALSQVKTAPAQSTRNMEFLEPSKDGGEGGSPDIGAIGNEMMGALAQHRANKRPMTGGTDMTPASEMPVMMAANGGPVLPGQTIVGERGPEMLQTDATGQSVVVPNHALPASVGGTAPQGGGALKAAQSDTSWKGLHARMPAKYKDKLADDIEERSGRPIREAYVHAAVTVGDTPKKKIDRREMAGYIAEVALRTMSNMGSSSTSAEAFSKGMLQTDALRAARAKEEQDKAEKEAETRRLEGREDVAIQEKQKYESSEKQKDRENALKLERMRAEVERRNRAGQASKLIIDAQGNYAIVDATTGAGTTVTRDVTKTKRIGARGQGRDVTTTTKEPVKAMPRQSAAGIDEDTMLRQITERKKQLSEDRKVVSGLRNQGLDAAEIDAELSKMARKQVIEDAGAVGGGGTVTDWNDLSQ